MSIFVILHSTFILVREYIQIVASRQGGPSVEEMLGIGSLPEPEAYAATVQRSAVEPQPQSPAKNRTPEDPPIRDPSRYAQTDHLRDRLTQPGRYISLPIISRAIESGQLRWNSSDGWRFVLTRDGVEFVVVVTDTETRSPVVVTGWTEVVDDDAAARSPQWTDTDIETIKLRSALSRHREALVPDQIQPRAVCEPFRIGRHSVTTEPGCRDVVCTDCGGRFRSKSHLCEFPCSR